MRGMYWSALIGLAIFTSAVMFAALMLALGTPNDGRDQQEQRARAAAEKCAAEIRMLVPATRSPSQQTVGEASPETKNSDLCQQIRMAVASEDAARYAKWQLLASLLGLLGIAGATIYAGLAYSVAKKALFDLERPHVFIEVVTSGMTPRDTVFGTGKKFTYRLVNYGRTPAQVIDLLRRYPVEANPNMPQPISPSGKEVDLWAYPDGVVVATNKPHEETDNLFALYGGVLMDEKALRKNRLFFHGRVRYADIFRDKYTIGFCFVFDPIGEQFVRWGDEQYNYTRKE